jgi:bifunctional enzyme CysN/CysC
MLEIGAVPDDALATLAADSRRFGTVPAGLDPALIIDGLEAERQQQITIDVGYRSFASARRAFMFADAPGHEQYTRNMVTAASVSDVAVVLVDARKGLQRQTRRHAILCRMMGIADVALVVNKMDAVAFAEQTFATIARQFQDFASSIGLARVSAIPVSALAGDNVARRSAATPWYAGPTLLDWLEQVEPATQSADSFRLPVQWVCRPNSDIRAYAGSLHGGQVSVGDVVVALPSGRESRVKTLSTSAGDSESAGAGDAVMVTLTDAIELSRGDVLAPPSDRPQVADQLAAYVINLSDEPLLHGRPYRFMAGPQSMNGSLTAIRYAINVDNLDRMSAPTLPPNGIGHCTISLSRPLVFDPYERRRDTGGFIIIDRTTGRTIGAGLAEYALRRSANVRWQSFSVDRQFRAAQKSQSPFCLWLTGLSGAGKSTIANLVEKQLAAFGRHTYLLDGDNVRHGLCRDLGFTEADRVENIRRVAEVARLMVDAGLIVIVSFISPFRSERAMARELFEEGRFLECFVDAPLAVCEQRDPKGLYAKARAGTLVNFTGIDQPYETPGHPELHLRSDQHSAETLAEMVLAELARRSL